MSALAHFFEDEGIATTGISLVREHTAGYRPPRFLWVPFPLGRPFGAPDEPAFQRRVLRAALALLERSDGPVILEDFPDDAPAPSADGSEEGWVCPVSFPTPPLDPDDLPGAVLAEVEALSPWYDLSLSRRGRTTLGLTGATPAETARFLAGFLEGTPAPIRPDVSIAENFKLACEELKAYYLEAAQARPGAAEPQAVMDWFWNETAAARLKKTLHERLRDDPDSVLAQVALSALVPRVRLE